MENYTNAEIKQAYTKLFKNTFFQDSNFFEGGLYYSHEEIGQFVSSLGVIVPEQVISTWEIYVLFEEEKIKVEVLFNYEYEASDFFTYDKPFEVFEFIKKYLKSEENVLC